MAWAVLIAMGLVSCHSKTVVREPSEALRSGTDLAKVTNNPATPAPLELFVELEFGPRRTFEIVSAVQSNLAVQSCLLASHAAGAAPMVFEVHGKIIYQGRFERLKIVGRDDPDDCLKTALKSIQMGRGKSGPFKLRLATGPDLIPGVKGLIISPPGPKKFE